MKKLFGSIFSLFILSCSAVPIIAGKDNLPPLDLDTNLRNILYYASLAPSGHNTQMWRVNVYPNDNRLEVLIDDTRLLKEVDPNMRESYISLGAFIENMRRAFQSYGYEADIKIATNRVDINYRQITESIKNDKELELMEKRHTDKRAYEDKPIPDDSVAKLNSIYGEGLKYYPRGSDEFQYLSTGTIDAMAQQSADMSKRIELSNWLRFSDEEALKKMDGLPAEQLGMKGIKKFFYYTFIDREAAKTDKFAKQGLALQKKQAENCSGFFLITGENSVSGWIKTGMLFESFWLDAAELNISIHPMSQMLEEAGFKEDINERLGLDTPAQMTVRAGVVKNYGKNNKIRRDISKFVSIIR